MIKVANCFFSAGIAVIVYFIIKEFANEESARIGSLCYGFFCFPLFYNTVLSNQIPGAFFFYLGMYFFVRGRKAGRIGMLAGSSLLIAIGNLLRPEGVIFIGAIVGGYVINLKVKNLKKSLFELIMIFAIYSTVFLFSSWGIKTANINKYGLENNNIDMKFVLGLNMESNGGWNIDDMEYLGKTEKQREIISERISKLNLKNILPFFTDKLEKVLGAGTLWWTFDYLDVNKRILGHDKNWYIFSLGEYNNIYYYIVFLVMTLGVLAVRNTGKESSSILFVNIIAINIVVYALIEVQARYAYIVQIAVFIVAGLGYERLKTLVLYLKTKSVISSGKADLNSIQREREKLK